MSMPNDPSPLPPCVVFEDDQILVVHKPPGWNTHAPAPYAGEGIYEWLKHREPRWASLAIVHRLDKETSGLLVFGKTPKANQSLTQQFTNRTISKRYRLRTDRLVLRDEFQVVSTIVRAGERYVSQTKPGFGDHAETRFRVLEKASHWTLLEAQPITGRTHQIRVHAAAEGIPILGDSLYQGSGFPRLCLCAAQLDLDHPESGRRLHIQVEPGFDQSPAKLRRAALFSLGPGAETTAYREFHGAGDGPETGLYVDRLGDYCLVQSETPPSSRFDSNSTSHGPDVGVYHKLWTRHVRRTTPAEAAPRHLSGPVAPERFVVLENGVRYELSLQEGYSVGLFLDQRDNRRRFLENHIAADFPLYQRAQPTCGGVSEVLNTFAYTCAFSVCAALGGARATSLDLSRKYLEWGRRNFLLNGLDPDRHEFIYGDCFEWIRRLAKKGRLFDAIILDPPTFSRSKEHGDFRTESDYEMLVTSVLPLLKPDGRLLASSNTARLSPEDFLGQVHRAIQRAKRTVIQEHYVPQPPDFPITREEPGYLKTVWLRVT
jgi:23S rRNA (cytosine1962-C5)-methyltransferase